MDFLLILTYVAICIWILKLFKIPVNAMSLLTAAFLQNSAQRLITDSEAEIAFPAVPGRIFKAKVVRVQEAIAQGQVQATGSLMDPDLVKAPGRVLVALKFENESLANYQIVPGTSGVVAVYTHHFHHLDVIRKVLLRMNSWTNYLFSDGH